MHIVMFGDQHAESSGGAQVSMRLQRRYLERSGHTVTIVAPHMWGRRFDDLAYVETPSIPIQFDREYSLTWPGGHADRAIDAAMRARPPVDVVHVQGDFWGAFLGYRFARRHALPVVHTMHNRVDVGIRAVTPLAPLVLRALNAWARRALAPLRTRGNDGWSYLAALAEGADVVTAPSAHFARRLERHEVFGAVDVVWNGIDDDVLDATRGSRAGRENSRPRLVWVGRMSPEKRLLPFLHALALADVDVDVEIIGGGAQERTARRLVARLLPRARVTFAGRLPYGETLSRLAQADLLVQTSIGFETQGMTPFEAASLGTPAIISDPDIAAEMRSGFWRVDDESVVALAAAIRAATTDVAAGRPVLVNATIADDFRQSSRTSAMIRTYESVVSTSRS